VLVFLAMLLLFWLFPAAFVIVVDVALLLRCTYVFLVLPLLREPLIRVLVLLRLLFDDRVMKRPRQLLKQNTAVDTFHACPGARTCPLSRMSWAQHSLRHYQMNRV